MSNPFQHEPRNMTPQRRAKLFALGGGKCACCTRKLGPADDWDIDHRIALANGGTDDDENMQVLCGWCHGAKTSEDVSEHARGRRAYTRHVVPSKLRRSKSWGKR